jgi:hypothetical protein
LDLILISKLECLFDPTVRVICVILIPYKKLLTFI